ncbi:hypothetical protein BBD41_16610 [Paenibacillus ihbetae]|uniref:Flagellar assembly protein FliT n=1 Tax=Paenibacillus ihbetae TaxID=1870820 RepID=A0A1B2E2A9_9BACL|nr:hypothetical protein [Paenibacillus ihbetae]ANY74071.1 hypothetical protein BBD41_16610 [Paenibacillus ihbetae]
MSLTAEEILLSIEEIYSQILRDDQFDSYLEHEEELEQLYSDLQKIKLDSKIKPFLEKIHQLNQQLVERMNNEKALLMREKDIFERKKIASVQYSNPATQYDSYFIDKKR